MLLLRNTWAWSCSGVKSFWQQYFDKKTGDPTDTKTLSLRVKSLQQLKCHVEFSSPRKRDVVELLCILSGSSQDL